jgi:hypothetical protein
VRWVTRLGGSKTNVGPQGKLDDRGAKERVRKEQVCAAERFIGALQNKIGGVCVGEACA